MQLETLCTVVGMPKPEVGMGATIIHWSDRSAYTITRLGPSGKVFWMTRDKVTRIDNNGMSESQQYSYESQPNITARKVVMGKRGQWYCKGEKVIVGDRREYYDYSF